MAIRVGRWDCNVCGHKGNPGPSLHCESCGAPRPKNVKFYLPEDAEIVKDEEKIKEAEAGPDWICDFCGAHNKATSQVCESCGAAKNYQNYVQPSQDVIDFLEKNKKKIKNNFKIDKKFKRIALVILLLTIGILLFGSISRKVDVKVEKKIWTKKYEIEKYVKVKKSDWSLPPNAELISKKDAVHHYDEVFDHYEIKTRKVKVKVGEEKYVCGHKDLGNGYFKDVYCTRPVYEYKTETYKEPVYKKIPIYKTKYTFYIWEWQKIKPITISDSNCAVYSLNLNDKNMRKSDSTTEYYLVIVDDKNLKIKEKVNKSLWDKVKVNDIIKAKKSRLFGLYIPD